MTSAVLLKHGSEWLKGSIVRSMMNRHADFVKGGDVMRATAVSEFLDRLGYPVPKLRPLGRSSRRVYVNLPGIQWSIVVIGLIASIFTIITGWDRMISILSSLLGQ